MSLLGLLIFIAVVLTSTMFATRQAMLGFPCAMFWAITGAQAYTLSTTPWVDIYYYIFFASMFGMSIFTMLAAFGLREKRDTIADEEMGEEGKGEAPYIDEEQKKLDNIFSMESEETTKRTEERRERARKRRGKRRERKQW